MRVFYPVQSRLLLGKNAFKCMDKISLLKQLPEVWSGTVNYIFGVTKNIINTPLDLPFAADTRKNVFKVFVFQMDFNKKG